MAKTQEEQDLGGRKGLRAELGGKKERIEERRGNPPESELRASPHCCEQLRRVCVGVGGWHGWGWGVSTVRSLEWVGCNSLRTSGHQRKHLSIAHSVPQ